MTEIHDYPFFAATVTNNSKSSTAAAASTPVDVIPIACPTPIGRHNTWQKFEDFDDFLRYRGGIELWKEIVPQSMSMAINFLQSGGAVVHFNAKPVDAELAHAIVCVAVRPTTTTFYEMPDGGKVVFRQNIATGVFESVYNDGTGDVVYADDAAIVAAGGVLKTATSFQVKPMIRSYPAGSLVRPTTAATILNYADVLTGSAAQDGSGYLFYPLFTIYADGSGSASNGFNFSLSSKPVYDRMYSAAKIYDFSATYLSEAGTLSYIPNMAFSLDEGMTIANAMGSKRSAVDGDSSMFLDTKLAENYANIGFSVTTHTGSIQKLVTLLNGATGTGTVGTMDVLFFAETQANILTATRDNIIPHNGTSVLLAATAVDDLTMKMTPYDIAAGSTIVCGSYLYDVASVNTSTGIVTLAAETPVMAIHPIGSTVVARTELESNNSAILAAAFTSAPTTTIAVASATNAVTGEPLFIPGIASVLLSTGASEYVTIASVNTQTNTVTLTEAVTLTTGLTGALSQVKDITSVVELESFYGPFALMNGTDGDETTIDSIIAQAYHGMIDASILDPKKFGINLVLTCGESQTIRDAQVILAQNLKVTFVTDTGIGIVSQKDAENASMLMDTGSDEQMMVAGSYLTDTVNGRRRVTITHGLSRIIPINDKAHGLHYNFVGPKRGVFSDIADVSSISYVPSTPDQFESGAKYRYNYLQIASNGSVYLSNDRTAATVYDVLGEFANARGKVELIRQLKKLFEYESKEYPTPEKMIALNNMLQSFLSTNWASACKYITGTVYMSDDDEINRVVRTKVSAQFRYSILGFTFDIELL